MRKKILCLGLLGFLFYSLSAQQQLPFIVTIDTATWKNMVVWQNPDALLASSVSSIDIYRNDTDGDGFQKIYSQGPSENPQFIDQTSDPSSQSYKYRIKVHLTTGDSVVSNYHQTMFIEKYIADPDTFGLNVQFYDMENMDLSSYFQGQEVIVYRSTDSTDLKEYMRIPFQDNLSFIRDTASDVFDSLYYYAVSIPLPDTIDLNETISSFKASSGPFSQSISNLEDNRLKESNSLDKVSGQNYKLSIGPNPYTDKVFIRYTLDKSEKVEIAVFNMIGNPVAKLQNKYLSPGDYDHAFSARELGHSAGVYFLRIKIGKNEMVRKLIETQ